VDNNISFTVFTGILSKKILRKAHDFMKSMASTSVGLTEIIPTDQEEVFEISEISDGAEKKPSVCFYTKTINNK